MMDEKGCIVFVQKRPHKAGAQTCLARLLANDRIRRMNPVLVVSQAGWLTRECERLGVPFIERGFPSSRSIPARLFGNAMFAGDVRRRLQRMGMRPVIVQANDHLEGLLALSLAKATGSRAAMFLRSPGMSRQDYVKYRCGNFDMLSAVGEELHERAKGWDRDKEILLIHDGVYPSEFGPPKPKAASFPVRLLVIGSPLDWKGWADMTGALFILSGEMALPPIEVDFTGEMPDPARNDLKLGRLKEIKYNFIGRVEGFRELVLKYDLVVNPTWHESFGMAAVETIAAGVPLLSSRTGIIEQVIDHPHMLFNPKDPASLARALGNLMTNWDSLDVDVSVQQRNILEKFNLEGSVDKLMSCYGRLIDGR